MSILQQARFFTTADQLHQLPMLGLPEVAFAGRSNSGKSTAINTLCQQRRLAFSSKTPGRTQHMNLFAIGAHAEDEALPAAFLVDLPGYGYAQVSQSSKAHWEEVLGGYIRTRSALAALILIMDARRPMMDLDIQMIEWFAPTGKPIHALLTKVDKLNRSESTDALRTATKGLAAYGPQHSVQLFSSLKKTGVEEAEARILDLLGMPLAPKPVKIAPKVVDPKAKRNPDAGKKKAPTQGE